MCSLAYYNGRITDCSQVRIGLNDRAVFFGDGVYDVMLAGKVEIYQQNLHLSRLKRNAARIGLPYPEELDKIIGRMVRLAGLEACAVYVQLSGSSDVRVHAPRKDQAVNLLVTVSEIEISEYSNPINAITTNDIRYSMCDVKTLNLLPSVLASLSARECSCDEALFVRDGIVTEGAKSNLFIVKSGIIYTHPIGNTILPGITRENVIRLANQRSIECCEALFGTNELFSADEVFITSTTKLLRQVKKIDNIEIGNGDFKVASTLGSLLYNEVKCSI